MRHNLVYTNGDGTETELTAADFEALRREKFNRLNKAEAEEPAEPKAEPVEEAVVEVVEEPTVEAVEEPVEQTEEIVEAVEEIAEEVEPIEEVAEVAQEPIEEEAPSIEEVISAIEEESALESVIDQILVDAETATAGRSYVVLTADGTPVVKRKQAGGVKASDFVFADTEGDTGAVLVPYTRAQYLALPRKKKKSVLMTVHKLLAYKELAALLFALKSRNSDNPRILERIKLLEERLSGLGKALPIAQLWVESVKRVKKY